MSSLLVNFFSRSFWLTGEIFIVKLQFMNKFLICRRQAGEGCDYTIGCGMRFDIIMANDIEHAKELAVFPDGRDEYSSIDVEHNDYASILIYVIPMESVVKIDCESILKSIKDEKIAQENKRIEDEELLELKRLQEKYKTS